MFTRKFVRALVMLHTHTFQAINEVHTDLQERGIQVLVFGPTNDKYKSLTELTGKSCQELY